MRHDVTMHEFTHDLLGMNVPSLFGRKRCRVLIRFAAMQAYCRAMRKHLR